MAAFELPQAKFSVNEDVPFLEPITRRFLHQALQAPSAWPTGACTALPRRCSLPILADSSSFGCFVSPFACHYPLEDLAGVKSRDRPCWHRDHLASSDMFNFACLSLAVQIRKIDSIRSHWPAVAFAVAILSFVMSVSVLLLLRGSNHHH